MISRNIGQVALLSSMIVSFGDVMLPNVAKAQEVRPLPVEDALKLHEVSSYFEIGFSPNAKWLAYTSQDNRQTRNVDQEEYARTGMSGISVGTDIWLADTKTGEQRSFTGRRGNNWHPTWSPDGKYIAFLSDRDGSDQARLWVWDTLTKDLRRASEVNIRGPEQIQWMPDSRRLLITTLPEGVSPNDYVRRMSTPEHQQQLSSTAFPNSVALYQSTVKAKSEKETPQSDPWDLGWRFDLVIVDVATGTSRVLVHDHRIQRYSLSPDGLHVAYTSPVKFENPGSQQILFDLMVVDISSGMERIVAPRIQLELGGQEFSWSPDNSHLVYQIGGEKAESHNCYVVTINGGSPQNITLLPPSIRKYRSAVPLWDRSGEYIYFLADGALWRTSLSGENTFELSRIPNRRISSMVAEAGNLLWTTQNLKTTVVLAHDDEGKQDGFYGVDLKSGVATRLFEKGQCYQCGPAIQFIGAKDQHTLAYLAEDAQHDNEIWVSDASFSESKQITHQNPQFERYRMGSAKLIHWLGDDGDQLDGVLLLPSDYRVGERYPLIVVVYGGGYLSRGFHRFGSWASGPLNMQLLATRGYAVLLPDSPQHPGTAMLDLVKTVLPGVNKVIEMGIADSNRLGVMGQSNGGYSTLALIVQTKRFKAAIDIDGMGDLISDYGAMDKNGASYGVGLLEHNQDAMGGTPWEFRERYIENSPVFYLDRIETPLLIVHGEADTTVAPFQSDEVFVGLRRLGKEVEYAKYEGEGHSPLYWSYTHKVHFAGLMVSWFDEHLKAGLTQQSSVQQPH